LSLTASEASKGPKAPARSWTAPLCMAARREGSASMVIGTRKGPAMNMARPETPVMAMNSQAGECRA
jgi:hypothetical protein